MNVVLGITGASGSIYAKKFIQKLKDSSVNLHIIFTETAKTVFINELNESPEKFINDINSNNLSIISNHNYCFKYASGSNQLDCMVILPCCMGSLVRIAAGLSADLIGRIADVQLKERRRLIICPRETPYNNIHLKNMLTLSECGELITPASPTFF